MVVGEMYYKIRELLAMGYSERRTARELGVDRGTVKKYSAMDEEAFTLYRVASMTRDRLFDPYREVIEQQLRNYPDIPASVIYDQLLEANPDLKPSKRTARLFVAQLREELGLPNTSKLRQFQEVAETLPGFQAQVDMGQQVMRDIYGKNVKAYIFAMVMSHSRQKYVCFQLKPFNGEDFVMCHDRAFRFFGGRTVEIVYDQDKVLAVSENAGNVLYTETFEAYKAYAGFSVRLCRGYDPQSKGKIEAVVKFVKGNFLKYRVFSGIDRLNSEGLAWLDRTANGQKHETTKLIPSRVFSEEMKKLKPVPTLTTSVPPKEAIIRPTNVVHYKQNRYEVPRGTYRPGKKALIEVEGDCVVFLDKDSGERLASHKIAVGVVGRLVQLPKGADRNRGTRNDALKTKVLGQFGNIPGASEFVSRILERFPRYNKDQLGILSRLYEQYSAEDVAEAVRYCTEHDLYAADEFRSALIYLHRSETEQAAPAVPLPEKYMSVHAQERPVSEYGRAMGGGAAL